MTATMPLKHYFGVELAERLSSLIQPHYPDFPADIFINAVAVKSEPLELKGRVAVIAEQLQITLPSSYPEALLILLKILGPENETEQGMFTNGYFLMPVAYFVEKYGQEYFDISMNALYEITKRHTSEYALRPFLERYPDDSIKLLEFWQHDPNLHVRRLVSEGPRPRLPWAKRIGVLKGDPAHNLTLLECLLNDPSLYVRKSVANHLNDLSKDYKEITLDWLRDRIEQDDIRVGRVAHHGLRSLVKSGDRNAIDLLKLVKK
ncbi:hypothetical protein [Paenibacillus dakarensis]|uniref:hypothetical protein n=1 Tax=Paenibacillus dakarensis TaxID=1527293 RepID=UPI0006D56C1D|nr:hypothetical protein [Paenibacillus dakarensis]